MKGYARTRVFDATTLAMLADAERAVAAIPDSLGEVRCHEVARAVAGYLFHRKHIGRALMAVDGTYGSPGGLRHEHSWIEVWPSGSPRGPLFIIDPYAVGRLPQVQLVDADPLHGLASMYREGHERADIDRALAARMLAAIDEALTKERVS